MTTIQESQSMTNSLMEAGSRLNALDGALSTASNKVSTAQSSVDTANLNVSNASRRLDTEQNNLARALQLGDQTAINDASNKVSVYQNDLNKNMTLLDSAKSDLSSAVSEKRYVEKRIASENGIVNSTLEKINGITVAKDNGNTPIETPPSDRAKESGNILSSISNFFGFGAKPSTPPIQSQRIPSTSQTDKFKGIVGKDDVVRDPTDWEKKFISKSNENPNHWHNYDKKAEINKTTTPPVSNTFNSKFDDLIAETMQPKYKHAYIAEFNVDKVNNNAFKDLETLNWLIKSMDRPKVDIEHVEQIRNNVKRSYPIKYNYGDLSITFWDDVYNDTITNLYGHFTKRIWKHTDVKEKGCLLLRDSSVIPQFIVYDLSIETSLHLQYTFYNALLVSFDFDAPGDEEEGVFTVQAVFKIERFDVHTLTDKEVAGILDPSLQARLNLKKKRN